MTNRAFETQPSATVETSPATGRRALLRTGLGAGFIGTVIAALGSVPALAAAPVDPDDGDETTPGGGGEPGTQNEEPDTDPATDLATLGSLDRAQQLELMALMLGAELAVRDLYLEALEAGADPVVSEAMSLQHRAYADAISGATGVSADRPSAALTDEWSGRFATADTAAMATAAAELESSLVATYEDLVTLLEDSNWVGVISSIAMMEARHSVVLSSVAGDDDVQAVLNPSAAPLTVEDLT